jgi:cathepsin B
VLAVLIAVVACGHQEIIDYVNNGNFNWKARYNAGYSDLSVVEAKKLLRTRVVSNEVAPLEDIVGLPDSFDSRTQWGSCIIAIRDQGQCGSCWAFGATESFSDRWCIVKGQSVLMSPQYVVSCDKNNYGCNGGYLNMVMQFLVNTGTVADACDPYFSGQNGNSGTCPTACKDGSALKFYKGSSWAQVSSNENSIMNEIYTNGPVEVAFTVYQDFMSYSSGVYHHVSGGVLGGHAVKNIGWGVSNGQKYWLIANSWGTGWGQSGYFWILKGTNECGIEGNAFAVKI